MSPKGGGESDQSEGDVSSKHLMENAFNPVPFCLFSFYCDQFETPKFVLWAKQKSHAGQHPVLVVVSLAKIYFYDSDFKTVEFR